MKLLQKRLADYLTEPADELRRHEKVETDSYVLENIRYLPERIVRLNPETKSKKETVANERHSLSLFCDKRCQNGAK